MKRAVADRTVFFRGTAARSFDFYIRSKWDICPCESDVCFGRGQSLRGEVDQFDWLFNFDSAELLRLRGGFLASKRVGV